MLKLQHVLIVFFCIVFSLNLKATHNRAGEITYKWLYGYTYEIKVTTYTNIGSGGLADRCQDTVYFGDGTSAVVSRINGPNTICGPIAHDGIPLSATIKLNEYVTTHTYPGTGTYKISMEDPNRNAGVINLPNSVNQVFYIESLLIIPAFGSGNNSSPILTFPPIDIACLNQCFYHNPGAYDTDGDSLSYELTYCRGNAGAICPGYSYPATGGGTFNVDSLTGTLSWCTPQLQGEYNMAMFIKEWRLDNNNQYILIGYVLRDLQVDVGACSNVPPHITINDTDTTIVAGTVFTTTIIANDPNVITLTADGGSFHTTINPSTFNSTPSSSVVSGTFNWNTDYTHIKHLPYQVTIKAIDNNSSMPLVHFNTFNIKIIPDAPFHLTTVTSSSNITLRWNKPVTYALSGTNKFFRYMVYRKTGLSNWVHANNETVPPASTGFAFIGVTNANINDTVFYDFNGGNPFIPFQDYSYVVLAQYDDGSTSYVSNIANEQIYVGIKEISQDNSAISIFPNPVSDNISVYFHKTINKPYTIELYDVTGRKLKTLLNNESIKTEIVQLKLDEINSGIYFLKVINADKTVTKKFIKQ